MNRRKDHRRFWHNPECDVDLLHAFHVDYAYPRHSHDHYVVCLIEQGVQSFTHKGTKYVTPPSGLILINPGVVHTGEAATAHGFQLRSIYPTVAHMQSIAYELTGRRHTIPYFREVRVDNPAAAQSVSALHTSLLKQDDPLQSEALFMETLAHLVTRYADICAFAHRLGSERRAVRQARRYIEERFAEHISLSKLAEQVALSPYYLLRVFRAEVGMPPHAYLQDVRIRRAQQLIGLGNPLADVALAVGYSSQSHLTRRFKQIVGVTPGKYAAQIHANRGLDQ